MLHLSVELVQEIVAYLDISDQKHLRSVSRYLAHTTDAIFFKTLPLKTISLTPEHHQTLVQSGWPRTATNLVIDGIAASTENPGREQFSRVLKSLQKVRTVRWDIGSSDQPWILQEISRFLSANSLLNDLWLGISNQCSDSVLRHALQELDGICNLGKLEIYCPYITTELISNTLVQLVSQNRRLETLKDNTSLPCAVWRALCDIPPPVHLKSLSTRLVTEELLEYLGTYSGLESITLSRFDARDDVLEQSLTDRLADNFFSTVVPKHAASLVELSLSPSYEGRWCLGTGSGFIFAALRSLPQIRRLSLCINSDDLPNYEGDLTLEESAHRPRL
ncbi:hypothetical protein C8F01DRAFT_1124027 [Mycena amicta]|nr:hypothetical protein C8F01DRAFT_1124027 [Mycena amicta]